MRRGTQGLCSNQVGILCPAPAPTHTSSSATRSQALPAPHSQQQWAMAILITGIHVHTSPQQHGDQPCVAPPRSQMQWCLTNRILQTQVTALR
jgi:hypothetical protein